MDDILAKKNRHLFLEEKDNQNNSFIGNVNTLVNNLEDIDVVADNITDVKLTGESIESVNTVAANIEDINNASTNIDTVKTFNDNVNNGTMQYLLEAFTTSLNEQGNAWEVRLTQLGESILATTSAFNYSTVATVSNDIPANGTLILPNSMKYKVGTHMLMVSWNGTVCYAGEQYDEVGAYGVWATSIKLNQPAKTGDKIQLRIVALTDQSSYVDITEAAINASQFTASGSNTERYLPEFLGDVVNVKNFGAVGNGVNDDTTAFQSAIASGKAVFVPEGTYKLNTDLNGIFCGVGNSTFTSGTVNGSTILRGIAYKNSDIINVKDFGAKGDGTTDDTTAIQNAIDAGSTSGNIVFMPAGTYITSSSLSIPSNTYLKGAGIDNTIILANTGKNEKCVANKHSLLRDATAEGSHDTSHWGDNAVYDENIVLEDFTIDARYTERFINTDSSAITNGNMSSIVEFGGVKNSIVSHVKACNAGQNCFNTKAFCYGNNLHDDYTDYEQIQGRCKNILFEDCIAYGCFYDDGFTPHMADDVFIRNCSIYFIPYNEQYINQSKHSQGGVEFDCGCRRCVAENVVCYGMAKGISIASHANELPAKDITFRNCIVYGADQAFTAWKDTDTTITQGVNENITIEDCVAKGVVGHVNNLATEVATQANFVSLLRAKNVRISNLICYADPYDQGLENIYINLNKATDCYFDGISVYNIPSALRTNKPLFNVVGGSSLVLKNLFSNCELDNSASIIIETYDSNVYSIDTVRTNGTISSRLYLLRMLHRGTKPNHLEVKNVDVLSFVKFLKTDGTDATFNVPAYKPFTYGGSTVYDGLDLARKENSDPLIHLGYGYEDEPHIAIDASTSKICFGIWDSSLNSGNGAWKTGLLVFPDTGRVNPNTDGSAQLGVANKRWSSVYASSGSINTSDEREKDNIAKPSEALMRAWGKVNFAVFQFKDAISKKGSNARIHVGVIAQTVQSAFAEEGLDANKYGLFCYDSWDEEYSEKVVVDKPEEVDETGNVVSEAVTHVERKKVQDAGNRYGIRYDEALALECAYQRWLGEQRDAKIEALMQRISALENNH